MYKIIKSSAFLILVLVSSIAFSKEFTIKEGIQKCEELNLTLPRAEEDGRIQTLNKKGAMSPEFDKAALQFIEFSKGKKVLEVGGAYGKIMTEVLTQYPDTIYHLNDLDERHLFIASQTIQSKGIDQKTLNNVKLISGDIVSLEVNEQYDAIFIGRVLHFFSPLKIQNTLDNVFHMLKPTGRVYVVAITPYVKRYKSFIPEYESRLSKKHPHPGYVESLKDWVNKEVTSSSQIANIHDEPFMFLDDKILSEYFIDAGFKIIKAEMVPLSYHSKSWSLDGRENVILVAEKR